MKLENAHQFYGYGSFQRMLLDQMARIGRLVSTWDDNYFHGFIDEGVAVRVPETKAGEVAYTLTNEGAHMMFHSDDAERGIHTSLYGNWRTKWEARQAGDLEPEQEKPVKVFRDGNVVTWVHDNDVCEVAL